jgi:flagellin
VGLRISTNLPSIAAQRALGVTQRQTEDAMKQLASGNRFSVITEGAGDHSIAESLKAQFKSEQAAGRNAEQAMSFVQVAEGALNEQNNILLRLRELAIQAASDTIGDKEREFLNMEFVNLTNEFDRIAKTARFGSRTLLMGQGQALEFQVGANKGSDNIIAYNSNVDTTARTLSVDGLRVDDKGDARDSLETIDEAMVELSRARAKFGSLQSRLESVTNNSMVQVENLQGAYSRMADTDVAKAYTDMSRGLALQQYQMNVLTAATQWPGQVLKLIA